MENIQQINSIIESINTIIANTKEINKLHSITSDKREILKRDTSKLKELAGELKTLATSTNETRFIEIAESLEYLYQEREIIDNKKTISIKDDENNKLSGSSDRKNQQTNYELLEFVSEEIKTIRDRLFQEEKKLEELKTKITRIEKIEKLTKDIEAIKEELPIELQKSIDKEMQNLGLIEENDSLSYIPSIGDILKMNKDRWIKANEQGNEKVKKESLKINSTFSKIRKRITDLEEISREIKNGETKESIQEEIEKIEQANKDKEAQKERQIAINNSEEEIIASMKELPADLRIFFANKLEENGYYSNNIDKFLSSEIDNVYELGTPGYTSIKDYKNRSEKIIKEIAETKKELAKYEKIKSDSIVEKIQALPNSDISKYSDIQKYDDIIKKNTSRLNSLIVEQQSVNKIIRNYNITNKLINNLTNEPEQVDLDEKILSIDNEEKQLPSVIEEKQITETEIPTMEEATRKDFENLLKLTKETKSKIKQTQNNKNTEESNSAGLDYESLLAKSEELKQKIQEAERGKKVFEALNNVNLESEANEKIEELDKKIENYQKELSKIEPLLNLYKSKEKQSEDRAIPEEKTTDKKEILLLEDKQLKEKEKEEPRQYKKYGKHSKEVKGIRKAITKIKEKIKPHLHTIGLTLLLITLGVPGSVYFKNKSNNPNTPEPETEITKDVDNFIPDKDNTTKDNDEDKDKDTDTEDFFEDWSRYTEAEESEKTTDKTQDNQEKEANNETQDYVTLHQPKIYDSIDSYENDNAKHPLFFEENDLTKVNAYVKKIIWRDENGAMKVENVEPEAAKDRILELQEKGYEVMMGLVYTKAEIDDYKEDVYGWVDVDDLLFYSQSNGKGHSR